MNIPVNAKRVWITWNICRICDGGADQGERPSISRQQAEVGATALSTCMMVKTVAHNWAHFKYEGITRYPRGNKQAGKQAGGRYPAVAGQEPTTWTCEQTK